MSILIKNIDITALKDDSSIGYKDIRIFADGSATTSSGKHPYIKTFEWVEVPTPHGDLIDRDKLNTSFPLVNDFGDVVGVRHAISINEVEEAPVIIESEE